MYCFFCHERERENGSMLKIDHLTITTHKGRVLLKDFSYVLRDGVKAALIGEEGNGKSTLLKVIAGEDVSEYVTVEGQVYSDRLAAYFPQKVEEKYLGEDVFSYVSHHEYDYDKAYRIFLRIGADTGLLEERTIGNLSGGERVKVGLARVLYDDPDLLLLDEPTNDLDLKTLIWLEEFLKNCSLTVLFISHDETLLQNCAEEIIHLEQLKRKEESHVSRSGESYEEYMKRRAFNISRNNQIAAEEKRALKKQLERYRQIYQKVEYRQSTITRQDPHGGQLLKKKMKSLKAQGRNLEEKEKQLTRKYEPEEAIDIRFEDVRINPNKVILDVKIQELYNGGRVLAENIELYAEAKDKICIIGENGCGKTTLLKRLLEELRSRDDITLGYMPQDYREVLDHEITPSEYLYRICEDKTASRTLLGSLHFTTEEMEHRISDLSEGQKCKVLLGGLILKRCDVLVLDEPTRNLSPLSGPELRKILREYRGFILSVSHDRNYIDEVADTVYELSGEGLRKIV